MIFNNVLNGKKRLSRLQKCENVHFFLRGYPMIFVKNWTFLLSLISFEKDLDVMVNYVRNEKKGCVDYKNVILRYCENGFF